MIGVIWVVIILFSLFYALINNNIGAMNDVILTISYDSLKIFASIASLLILWSGVLEIAQRGGFLHFMSKGINKIIHPFFSKDIDPETLSLISGNIACNFIGLGSASTPFGLAAMKKLNEKNSNKKVASKDMCTLIIFNTCGLSLLPTSILALRKGYNSKMVVEIIPYILIVSLISTVVALLINGVMRKWA